MTDLQKRALHFYFRFHFWFVAIALFATVFFLAQEIDRRSGLQALQSDGKSISATVIGKHRVSIKGNMGRSNRVLEFSYQVPGRTDVFTREENVPNAFYDSHSPGDTIEITVSRSKPEWSETFKGYLAYENQLGFASVVIFALLTVAFVLEGWWRERTGKPI